MIMETAVAAVIAGSAVCSDYFEKTSRFNPTDLSEHAQCVTIAHDINSGRVGEYLWVRTGYDFTYVPMKQLQTLSNQKARVAYVHEQVVATLQAAHAEQVQEVVQQLRDNINGDPVLLQIVTEYDLNLEEIKDLEEFASALIQIIDATSETIDTLFQDIADYRGDIEELEGQVDALETLRNTLQGDVSALDMTIETLEGQIADKDEMISDLEADVDRLEGVIDSRDNTIRGIRRAIGQAVDAASDLVGDIQNLQTALTAAEARATTAEANLATANATIVTLTEERDRYQRLANNVSFTLNADGSWTITGQDRIPFTYRTIEDYNLIHGQLTTAQAEVVRLERELSEAVSARDTAISDLATANTRADDAEMARDEAQADLAIANAEVMRLNGELTTARNTRDTYTITINGQGMYTVTEGVTNIDVPLPPATTLSFTYNNQMAASLDERSAISTHSWTAYTSGQRGPERLAHDSTSGAIQVLDGDGNVIRVFDATTASTLSANIDAALNEAFNNGYDEGYADGYVDGYADGWADARRGAE